MGDGICSSKETNCQTSSTPFTRRLLDKVHFIRMTFFTSELLSQSHVPSKSSE